MSRAIDGKSFTNISANTAAFTLDGGLYGIDVSATGAGTVKLQKQRADGTTYASVSSATDFAASPGYATVSLPAGTYRLTIATFTAIYANVRRIPAE
jgi:hypothetical protein